MQTTTAKADLTGIVAQQTGLNLNDSESAGN